MGRPTIVAVRIRNGIIRIQITRRHISIIRIRPNKAGFHTTIFSTIIYNFRGYIPLYNLFVDLWISFWLAAKISFIPLAAVLRLIALGQTHHCSGTYKKRHYTQSNNEATHKHYPQQTEQGSAHAHVD